MIQQCLGFRALIHPSAVAAAGNWAWWLRLPDDVMSEHTTHQINFVVPRGEQDEFDCYESLVAGLEEMRESVKIDRTGNTQSAALRHYDAITNMLERFGVVLPIGFTTDGNRRSTNDGFFSRV